MTRSHQPPSRPATRDGLDRQHVALVGFMGAGKTSVGKLFAERLGLAFVDLDEVIAEQAGQNIPQIFREYGEVGFRARERAALRQVLASSTPSVIATGGGTYVDSSMRGWIREKAFTIFLRAGAETIGHRLASPQLRRERPLLHGPDPLATVKRLLEERTPAYEDTDLSINTDGLETPQVVEELVRLLGVGSRRSQRGRPLELVHGAATVQVQSASHAYTVELRAQAAGFVAEAIAKRVGDKKVCIVTDRLIHAVHATPLAEALRQLGKTVQVEPLESGEGSKSIETAARLWDVLLGAGFARGDWLVALGGGVVGDLTGFVASTLLRGVPYLQIPTTTLAAVDSSVGGKTAINTAQGKNLVGTFYPPQGVCIAGSYLATQSRRAHAAGLVEALKIAACCDANLFNEMVQRSSELLSFGPFLLEVIGRAVQLKADIVSRDERENGERAILNYGHTLGHAIEVGEGFRLLHGEAVGLGMLAEAAWAEEQGAGPEVGKRLLAGLNALGVPTEWRVAKIDTSALEVDKKRVGGGVRLPMVSELGHWELRTVPMASLSEFVSRRMPG